MADEEAVDSKGVYLFGRDISQIPCFRNSYLYGISTGLIVGLGCFMFTSKVNKAINYANFSFFGTTMTYWFYCRYNYSVTRLELQKVQHLLEKKVILEGTMADIDISPIEGDSSDD